MNYEGLNMNVFYAEIKGETKDKIFEVHAMVHAKSIVEATLITVNKVKRKVEEDVKIIEVKITLVE